MRRSAAFAVTVTLVLAALGSASAGAPTEQLREYTEHVIKVLEDPALREEDRRAAVRRIAQEVFDVQETARRALGRHWHARTPAERFHGARGVGQARDGRVVAPEKNAAGVLEVRQVHAGNGGSESEGRCTVSSVPTELHRHAQVRATKRAPQPLPQIPARPNIHIAAQSAHERSNLATVQHMFDALNAGNETGFLAMLADGVVIAFGRFLFSNIVLSSDFLWFISFLFLLALIAAASLFSRRDLQAIGSRTGRNCLRIDCRPCVIGIGATWSPVNSTQHHDCGGVTTYGRDGACTSTDRSGHQGLGQMG